MCSSDLKYQASLLIGLYKMDSCSLRFKDCGDSGRVTSSSGLASSSIEMRLYGRSSVTIFLTLGELGSLEVGVINLEDVSKTEGSVSGSEILGSSASSLEGEILRVTLETEIAS